MGGAGAVQGRRRNRGRGTGQSRGHESSIEGEGSPESWNNRGIIEARRRETEAVHEVENQESHRRRRTGAF